MQHNPTQLEYDALEAGNAPKFGVSPSPSTDFPIETTKDLKHIRTTAEWCAFWLALRRRRASAGGELVQV